tara:strand:+ start:1028 stop:1252 length:225 start_codon:yes stop_codon:yes gene_type:complete
MDNTQVLLDTLDHLAELLEANYEEIKSINQERLDTTHEITTSKLNDLNIRAAKALTEQVTLSGIVTFLKDRTEV